MYFTDITYDKSTGNKYIWLVAKGSICFFCKDRFILKPQLSPKLFIPLEFWLKPSFNLHMFLMTGRNVWVLECPNQSPGWYLISLNKDWGDDKETFQRQKPEARQPIDNKKSSSVINKRTVWMVDCHLLRRLYLAFNVLNLFKCFLGFFWGKLQLIVSFLNRSETNKQLNYLFTLTIILLKIFFGFIYVYSPFVVFSFIN